MGESRKVENQNRTLMKVIHTLLLAALLTICVYADDNTCEYLKTYSAVPPTSLDTCDWSSYAKFPVTLFVTILVLGVIISFITSCTYLGRKCCRSQYYDDVRQYKRIEQDRISYIFIGICAFVVALCLTCIAAVIVHSIATDRVIVATTSAMHTTYDKADNYVGGNISITASKTSKAFLSAEQITVDNLRMSQPTIEKLLDVGSSIRPSLTQLTVDVTNNIKPQYDQLSKLVQELKILVASGVEDLGILYTAPDITDITSSLLPGLFDTITKANQDVGKLSYNFNYLKTVVDQAYAVGTDAKLLDNVHKLTNISNIMLHGKFEDVFDFMKENIYSGKYVNVDHAIRGITITIHIVIALFFVLLATFFLCGVKQASSRSVRGMKCQACCSWFWIFFFIASCAISILVFSLLYVPYCQQGVRSEIYNPYRLKQPMIGDFNLSRTLTFAYNTMHCSGDTTFFDIAGVAQNATQVQDLASKFTTRINELRAVSNGFYMKGNKDIVKEVQEFVDSSEMALNALSGALGYNFTELTAKINSYSLYSQFSIADYDGLITSVNDITTNVTINTPQGPEEMSFIYDRVSISGFTTQKYPLNSLLNDTLQVQLNILYAKLFDHDIPSKYKKMADIMAKGTNIIIIMAPICKDMANYIPDALESIPTVRDIAKQVLSAASDVDVSLKKVDDSSVYLTQQMTSLATIATEVLSGPKCEYVGQAVQEIDTNICGMMFYSVPSFGVACFVIGILLSIAYLVALIATERFATIYNDLEIDIDNHTHESYGTMPRGYVIINEETDKTYYE